MSSHYEVLGISNQATDEEIREAYRKKARQWHPDRNPGNENEAAIEFLRIQSAYETLTDQNKRAAYGRKQSGTATSYDDLSESIDPEIVLRLAESRKIALDEMWKMAENGKSKKEIDEKIYQIMSVGEKREVLDDKIMDMVQTGQNLMEIIKQLDQTESSLVTIQSLMGVLEEDLKTHQTRIRRAKGVGATAGAVGAVLFFTPLAPVAWVGMAVGGVSSALGFGASVGDFVQTRKAKTQIENYCKTVKEELSKLGESLKALEYTTPTGSQESIGTRIKAAAGFFRIGRFGDAIFIVDDIVGIGSNVGKIMGPALASVGACFSAIDAVYTAVNENEAIGKAQTLQSDLICSIKAIEDLSGQLKKEMKRKKKMKQNLIGGSNNKNMLTYQEVRPEYIGFMIFLFIMYIYVFVSYG